MGPSLAGLVFDSSGNLFAARNATTGDYTTGAVLQLDPSNASVIQTVATIPCAEPLSIDPLSGDLFTDDSCGGGGANTSLWRIHSPASSPTVSVYTTLPSAPNANIGFAPNGTMYVWSNSQAVQVSGTNGPTPPTVTTLPSLSLYYLGLLAYGSQTNGDAQYLIANIPANTSVNPNVPTTTSMVDLTTSPPTVGATIIANGGGGNMITGPDGCIYMSLGGGGVWKITDTTGACKYTGTATPSISLTPTTLASNPQQGKPQTFTARFHDVTVADGTPVSLSVTGANPQFIQVNSAGGAASFTYTGAHQGVDTITASATVSSSLLTSNQAVITWGPGSDVTFLTLNLSPTGSAPGQPVTVTANLTDVSDSPSVALAGQSVNFTIGGAGCGGTTNSSGDASCQITPSGSGLMTLAANFPGTSQYNASSDSKPFSVVAPEAATPTPTPTATATATATPTATPTPVVGKLKVRPKVLNFGDVEVGSSDTRTVKIINAGKVKKKKVPLPILIEMESPLTSPFSITQTCDDDDLAPRAKKMPPGSCEVSVKFAPTAAIKYSGKLMIDDNLEPALEKTVRLEGTGKEPKK